MGSLCSTSGVLSMTFLLFAFVLIDHGAVSSYSGYKLCPKRVKRLVINDSETFFMPAKALKVSLEITARGSPLKANIFLKFVPFKNFAPNVIQDSEGNSWLPTKIVYTPWGNGQVSWEVEGPNPISLTKKLNQFIFSWPRHPVYTITFSSELTVAMMCNSTTFNLQPASSSTSPRSWLSDIFDDSKDSWDSQESWEEEKQLIDDLTNRQNREHIPRHYSTSFRGGHIIFIPVGAIIFLLSVCLRCCLCRKQKNVAQRVRTIAVVRRVPVSSMDFVQVSQASSPHPTSPNLADLPPSYDDVESEVPPPSYDEIASREADDQQQTLRTEVTLENEKAVEPSTEKTEEETGLTAEAVASPPPPSSDAEGTEGGPSSSRSSLARVFNASALSLRSQFAFKPMKEEQ